MSDRDFWEAVDRRRAAGEKVDVHTFRASWESGVPENETTPTQREAAKCLNYAHLYTSGAWSLACRIDAMRIARGKVSDDLKELMGRFYGLAAPKDSFTEERYVAPFYENIDFSAVEARIKAHGTTPTAGTRALTPFMYIVSDPVYGYIANAPDLIIGTEDTGVSPPKIGRDGKPVRPTPYYRTQEKKRGKQY